MEFVSLLWLPILLSAVFVFIVSSLVHMVLGYHAGDYQKLPNEDATMDALRSLNIPGGHYTMPKASSMKDFKNEAFKAKMNKRTNKGANTFIMIRSYSTALMLSGRRKRGTKVTTLLSLLLFR